MVFLSAGHNWSDSGAAANGYQENNLMIEFRDLVLKNLKAKGLKVITDKDSETLSQYLSRIQTGNGSVVVEFHMDAAANTSASGCTVLVEEDADRLDKAMAKEIADCISDTYKIKNRGVKPESYSARGRLGLMREEGIIALVELGFITNKDDLRAHLDNKEVLACRLADIIEKYENMIQ